MTKEEAKAAVLKGLFAADMKTRLGSIPLNQFQTEWILRFLEEGGLKYD